jgi:hypothetical protein
VDGGGGGKEASEEGGMFSAIFLVRRRERQGSRLKGIVEEKAEAAEIALND